MSSSLELKRLYEAGIWSGRCGGGLAEASIVETTASITEEATASPNRRCHSLRPHTISHGAQEDQARASENRVGQRAEL